MPLFATSALAVATNAVSRIEIEVLVVSAALVVMPVLAAAVYLVWRYAQGVVLRRGWLVIASTPRS